MLNKISILISIVLLCILIYFKISERKVAYANLEYIIINYEGMKDATIIYETKMKKWEAKIDSLSSDYKEVYESYVVDSVNLSKNEKISTYNLLLVKRNNIIKIEEAFQKLANEEDSKLTNGVIAQVNEYVAEYGKLKNYDIIYGSTKEGSLLFAKEKYNITEDIIDFINEKYKN